MNDDETSPDKIVEAALAELFVPQKPAEEECWMQTYTGAIFYPLKPRVADVRFQDIAGSLSKLCRFAGHVNRFYSVAEHCVHVSRYVVKKYRLAALLHDASEAYLVDIPRPLKPWLVGYKEIEDKLMAVVAERFGFEYPMHPGIKEVDLAILSDEREQSMAYSSISPRLWGNVYPRLGVRLQFWSPDEAQFEFTQAFHELYSPKLGKLQEPKDVLPSTTS